MIRACTFLGFLCAPLLASAGSPPTQAEFTALAVKSLCEQPAPGRVIYAGDSAMLDSCLEMVPGGEIHELRITSRGGLADDTLKSVLKYRGHLDHVIVEGLCAGNCAGYILPAARRVSVAENSYVLLQRATNARLIDEERARIFADFRKRMPDTADDEINRMIDRFREKALADAPREEAFAKQTLACDEWLDPTKPPERALPATSTFLLVTPDMAMRCLKNTRIESFWAPEAQDKFAPELGFFRARR